MAVDVITTWYAPVGVPLTVVIDRVELPELAGIVDGLKFAVAPGGRPVTLNAISPAPPN